MENEIAYYDKMIERYKGEDSEYEFDQEERAAQAVELEADIAAAVAILEQLIDDANVIIGEHNQVKVSEVIRPLTAPQRQSGSTYPYTAPSRCWSAAAWALRSFYSSINGTNPGEPGFYISSIAIFLFTYTIIG